MKNTTSNLFAILKELIPELPAKCRRLEMILEANTAPIVKCEFLISDISGIQEHLWHKSRFEITEIKEPNRDEVPL